MRPIMAKCPVEAFYSDYDKATVRCFVGLGAIPQQLQKIRQ
jgi:hypothetical protein